MQAEGLSPAPLVEVLTEARRRGFLGPAPVEDHVQHSLAFVDAWGTGEPAMVVDLGSGGGVPGLILALSWSKSSTVLLEAGERRARFLTEAARQLGLTAPRVEVVRQRAEVFGREDRWRSAASLVTARSFGPPAVVAECSAPLLTVGGRLIVSEPPSGGSGRWPEGGLNALGLVAAGSERHRGYWYRVLTQEERCPERFPRRSGMPAKRPLF